MSDRPSDIVLIDEHGDSINNNNPLSVDMAEGFDLPKYDYIELTYVATGNGEGEIETVVYKLSTVTLATLTLAYNVDDKLISVTKT